MNSTVTPQVETKEEVVETVTMVAEKEVETNINDTELGDPETSLKPLDTFVFMDKAKEILDIAFDNNRNVILYGPGGYAKSDFSLEYLIDRGIEPFIQTMGSGMTTDRLFGGLDIPRFNATGKVEYLVENSFMNQEYVIFEELFDAPDYILEQLKDILSSKVFRNGGQIYPIKTKLIICCTNKTREEFSKNNSLKALMERFPLELKVQWTDHTRLNYEKLFNTKLGFADPLLTYLLEQYAAAGSIISPRVAIIAANLVANCGPTALNYIADFSAKPDILKNGIAKFNSILEIGKKVKVMQELVDKFVAEDKSTTAGLKQATSLNKKLFTEVTALKNIKADDSLVTTSTEAIKKFTQIHTNQKKELDLLLMVDDIDTGDFNNSMATNA